ncbi:MAG: hypothetical protein KF678_11905 [Phycisphaeraceae bacterium]|nr:hypothetical protein [Phycisphaeraceae bacterium]
MAMPRVTSRTVAVLLLVSVCRAQECLPFWTGIQRRPSYGTMVAFDAGHGAAIYTDGFAVGAPPYTDPPRRWNGHIFEPPAAGWMGETIDLRVLDDGTGPKLYAISIVDGLGHRRMFRWPGVSGSWEPTPPGMFHISFPGPQTGSVIPMFSSSTPGMAGLYGVKFDYPAGLDRVVRWNGRDWDSLGSTASPNEVYCMAELPTAHGPNLVVAGYFPDFEGFRGRHIVRWNGQQWFNMGNVPGSARVMITWDDGNGPALYIGWTPEESQPPLVREGIARWTGATWASVGGGLYQAISNGGSARDMVVFDDGTGPALFVLGRFDCAGGPNGIPARNIAKWDGQQWHALGAGVGGFPDHLAVADDGRGPSLFVSGDFSFCGGGQVGRICQWVGCAGNRQCYADCDNNRVLTANDFMCFLNKYAARDPYANCDGSAVSPVMTAADFQCFLNKYAQGCSR